MIILWIAHVLSKTKTINRKSNEWVKYQENNKCRKPVVGTSIKFGI